MNDFKRRTKNRSKHSLFNPYENGISSYDLAYLSSKRISKKTIHLKNDTRKEYLSA